MFFILNFNLQNMLVKQISLALMLLLSIASCKKEETTTNTTVQRLVFGTYFGECLTDCVTIFALDSANVQQDTLINTFIPINYVFAGVDLSNDKFEQVKHLLTDIPTELTTTPNKTYGCPDCHDQGGIYVEVTIIQAALGGNVLTTHKYTIDTDNTTDQSSDILSFKTKILTAIQQLN